MPDFDEDAVVEALRRIQPALDAMALRIQALEERPEPATDAAVVHPITVTNTYEDQPPKTWRLEE